MVDYSGYENFQVDVSDGIAELVIDSTSKMNALNRTMSKELLELASELAEDDDARCIVLTGSDGVFCAGGDISGFESDSSAAASFRRGASLFHDAVIQLHYAEKPIVTGVNGPAVGAGFSLALTGDITVMSEDAYLQFGYSGIGLTGDGGCTFYLPRLVGLRQAKEIALRNEEIGAERAREIGLVTETASADAFDDALADEAVTLADGPTVAYGRTKRLLTDSLGRSIEEQLAAETRMMARTAYTDDYVEGVSAFQERREPEFTGR